MFQGTHRSFCGSIPFCCFETASNVTGDSASGGSSSSATGSTSASASTNNNAKWYASATPMSDAEKLAQVGNTVYFGFDRAELSGSAQATR